MNDARSSGVIGSLWPLAAGRASAATGDTMAQAGDGDVTVASALPARYDGPWLTAKPARAAAMSGPGLTSRRLFDNIKRLAGEVEQLRALEASGDEAFAHRS